MAIEDLAQEKEIDGVMYKSQPVRSKQGTRALLRLMRIVGPIFASALRETGRASIAAALEALPTALTDGDVEYFSELFGTASWYAGDGGEWKPLAKTNKIDLQDEHWAGRYLQFLRWLIFNVEVNFGGFFAGVAGEAGDIKNLIKIISGDSKESPGSSGSSGGSSMVPPTTA